MPGLLVVVVVMVVMEVVVVVEVAHEAAGRWPGTRRHQRCIGPCLLYRCSSSRAAKRVRACVLLNIGHNTLTHIYF